LQDIDASTDLNDKSDLSNDPAPNSLDPSNRLAIRRLIANFDSLMITETFSMVYDQVTWDEMVKLRIASVKMNHFKSLLKSTAFFFRVNI
jgi:hypothetical protein